MKLLPLLFTVIFSLSPARGAYTLDCGNPYDNDPGCDCPPCPANSGANPVNTLRGGLLRTVTDIKVFGPASFEFKRIYNSRTRSYTQRSWEFGTTYTWQHNWQYEIRESNQTAFGIPALIVRYPEGKEKYFFATDSSGSVRVADANFGDRLYPTATATAGEFILRTQDGREYLFQKNGTGGNYQYLLREVRAGQGFKWTLTYQTQSDGLQRLYRITNNYGRYIQLSRTQVSGSNFWRVNSVATNDGRSVSYGYGTWAPTSEHVLNTVTYPDATTSDYTWVGANSLTTGSPILGTASDPTYGGAGARCRYVYNYTATYGGTNIVNGTILEERNLDTGEITVSLPLGGGTVPKILEGGVNEIVREFAGNNNVTKMSDAEGRTVVNTYQNVGGLNNSGFLLTSTDDAGAVTTYTRDAIGRILTRTDALGGVTTYTYNNAGFILTTKDALNRTTAHIRDSANRITRTNYPDSTYETFTYTGTGLLKTKRFRNASNESYSYNGSGDLVSHTDAAGHTTTYTSFQNGLRATATTALGHTTSFQYDWQGRLTKTTHPDNTFRTRAYDTFGNLSLQADELLNPTTMTYDAFNRISTITDPLNRITTYTYGPYASNCGTCSSNGSGNPIAITHPDGTVTTFSYDLSGKTLTTTRNSTTPLYAATSTVKYDNVGNIYHIKDALGAITLQSHDLLKRRISVTDPLNRITGFTYDAVGNMLTNTAPDLTVTTRTYDVMNRTASIKDALNHTTTYGYDVPGRKTTATDPLNRTMEILTNALGRTVSRKDGTGAITLTAYDADGRVLTVTDPTGAVTTYGYNSRGHLLTANDPLNNTTAFEVDPLGRTTATITPASTTAVALSLRTEYGYDAIGNLLFTKRPDGEFILSEYDSMNRRVKLTEPQFPQNHITLYGYHPTGTLKTLTDPKGQITEWTYDRMLRLTEKEYANGNTHLYQYDTAGQLYTHKTPNLHTATYAYDVNGRLRTKTWNTTTPSTTYDYFADGQLKSVVNGATTVAYQYDAAHQLVSDTQSLTGLTDISFTATYDGAGRRKDTTYSANRTVKYEWTTRGQLESVETDGPPPFATYGYDAIGRTTSLAHENGVSEAFGYDENDRLLSRGQHAYTLDNLGRRTGIARTGDIPSTGSYDYDPLGQVTAADYGSGANDTYGYDKAGNRSTATVASLGGSPTTYTVNNANQYTTISGVPVPIAYDANGNLTQQNGNTYTWDSDNRLLSVVPFSPVAGAKAPHYTYDGLHRRILRTVVEWDGSTWTNLDATRYIYDGWNVVEEYTVIGSSQTLVRTRTWGTDVSGNLQGAGGVGGLLLTEEISGSTTTAYHYHYDGNGNVSRITDANGSTAAAYRYDAFGNTLAANGSYATTNKYRFSTKPLDDEIANARLYYYGYRYYDPASGRWPSRDPIGERGGANLYGFVMNEPVSSIDLLGLVDPGVWLERNEGINHSPWSVVCNRCTKANGDFKMDCYLVKNGKKEYGFETNDYDEYVPSSKGNQVPNSDGLDGAELPEGDKYRVTNDNSGYFGPNTPSISNNGNPGEVVLPGGITKTNVRIHPQVNQSQGCVTICDTNPTKSPGSPNQDDVRSPHMNLIRELIKKHGSMKMSIKDVGPCDPKTCKEDYVHPSGSP